MKNQTIIKKEQTTRENRIWVRIASACNVKCVFCLDSDAQNGTFPKKETILEQISSWYKKWMTNRVIISWWEASINPKFYEYIRYAKEIWYDKVQTVTNGNMFSRYEFCDRVVSSWLSEVTFSIHWHTPELHDYLTAAPWSFKKAIQGVIILKKYFPQVIINIDIVVNKVNIKYLPKMIKFFMRLWVYEFDVLQIIPFWRWFQQYKDTLFYKIEDYIDTLHETWKYSRIPGVYMWTNRFPAEAFEWYEDLIQDPRKIKSEVMWEAIGEFSEFISSKAQKKPHCFGDSCNYCFLNQYCHDYIDSVKKPTSLQWSSIVLDGKQNMFDLKYDFLILRWEEFMSDVYEKYGKKYTDFISYIRNLEIKKNQKLVNIPPCISEKSEFLYEDESHFKQEKTIESYTKRYINNFYRKKSPKCSWCVYNKKCKWIHINFIRAYWFKLLTPIKSHEWWINP